MIHYVSASAFSIQTPGWLLVTLVALVGLAVLTAITYSFVNMVTGRQPVGVNVIRALLALVLVGAVVLMAGAALAGTGTEQTANLLVGGVVASAASAITFYFTSRNNENQQQATQAILDKAFGTEIVPDLTHGTLRQAQVALSHTSLILKLPQPPNGAIDMDRQVRRQQIPEGTTVAKGTVLEVF